MSAFFKCLIPGRVFEYFEELTRIPRESGNEEAVAMYLEGFGKALGLKTIRDHVNNVIIEKPGTAGYENAKTVILQGHTDMVCVALDDLDFDFSVQPIPLVIDGDYIKTRGTTLGADNGIAVAMAMSILADDTLAHPPLVCLFTTSEETGMDGVMGLEPGMVKGDILINIDSEEEGVVLASCAGGVNNITEVPIEWVKNPFDATFKLVISGLTGGHSGIEIAQNRANAIKLMGRVMTAFKHHFSVAVSKVTGGEKMNAIAKRSEMVFSLKDSDVFLMEELVASLEETFKREFEVADPGISLTLNEIDLANKVYSQPSQLALETLLRLTPFAVYTMSAGMKGLVESSNNLGVLEQLEDSVKLTNAIRSSVKSLKQELNEVMALISEAVGGKNTCVADYPEWPFKVTSPVRELMKSVYAQMTGEALKVEAIHAGLECGFLKDKVGDIDMVSIGPNLYEVHTPYEHLSISSTERVYAFLCEVLKQID